MSSALLGRWRLLFAVICCWLPVTAAAAPAPHNNPLTASNIIPGYVIVQFHETANALAKAHILTQYPPLRETAGIYRLAVTPGSETRVAATLAADPSIALAAPDQTLSLPPSVQNWQPRPASQPLRQPEMAAEAAPSEGQAQATPTPTPGAGPAITRLWLSDTRLGNPPRGLADEAGKCGPRFNATRPIWVNLEYLNVPPQTVRVNVSDLGFLNRVPGSVQFAGWSANISASGNASDALRLNQLKVGCYEVKVSSSDFPNQRAPTPVRFQIVTAPLQDDSYPYELWHLDQTRAYDHAGTADIKATGAWNVTTGSTDTVIALISSGVQTSHPEFAGRLVPGYNTLDGSTNVNDDYGYGSFLAGFIAAKARNDDIACTPCNNVGVNWNARIMPIKVMGTRNTPQGTEIIQPTFAGILEAINYASRNGARIILVSFPIDPNDVVGETQDRLRFVISTATNTFGALVVAPVGDDAGGTRPPNTRYFPAALSGEFVLAVTATNEEDQHWTNAYSGEYVDLAAPGWHLLAGTTIPDSSWYPGNVADPSRTEGDTAVAAAQVAGIAGLIWSVNPYLSPGQVQQILKETADKVDSAMHSYNGAGHNDWLGYGRVNAEAALWRTPHNMTGAFKQRSRIEASLPGTYCTELDNTRTGAITWTPRVAPVDSYWVSVEPAGNSQWPYSARHTIQEADYQGDLPSWAKVCVKLGPSGQTQYNFHKARIIIESKMPNDPLGSVTATQSIDFELTVWYYQTLHKLFLPFLEDRAPWRGGE